MVSSPPEVFFPLASTAIKGPVQVVSKKTLIVMFALVDEKDLMEDGRNCWRRDGLKVEVTGVERDFLKQFIVEEVGWVRGTQLIPFVSRERCTSPRQLSTKQAVRNQKRQTSPSRACSCEAALSCLVRLPN